MKSAHKKESVSGESAFHWILFLESKIDVSGCLLSQLIFLCLRGILALDVGTFFFCLLLSIPGLACFVRVGEALDADAAATVHNEGFGFASFILIEGSLLPLSCLDDDAGSCRVGAFLLVEVIFVGGDGGLNGRDCATSISSMVAVISGTIFSVGWGVGLIVASNVTADGIKGGTSSNTTSVASSSSVGMRPSFMR